MDALQVYSFGLVWDAAQANFILRFFKTPRPRHSSNIRASNMIVEITFNVSLEVPGPTARLRNEEIVHQI